VKKIVEDKRSVIYSNSVQQGPSWEAVSHSAGQEIPHLLQNRKVHYRVQKRPATGPCIELDESTAHLLTLFSILILSSQLLLGLPSGFFSFSDQNFKCISHFSHACYMLHPSSWFLFWRSGRSVLLRLTFSLYQGITYRFRDTQYWI